jgi:hypothetical protein
MTATLPKRILLFASASEGIILDSVYNALSVERIAENVSHITILHDSNLANSIDMDRVNDALSITGKLIEFAEVPIMNDILNNNLELDIRDGDCFALSGTQLHISLIKNEIQRTVGKSPSVISVYLCLVGPEGETVHWVMVNGGGGNKIQTDYVKMKQKTPQSLSSYFRGDAKFARSRGIFNPSMCRRLIKLEAESFVLKEFKDNITEIANKKTGFAFEELAADYLATIDNVAEIIMNFELKTEWKYKKKEPVYLEEDIIILTKKGNVIIISCKYRNRVTVSDRKELEEEIARLEVLRLPIKIPKERFQNVLLTTTVAKGKINYSGSVIVTNLLEIADKIKHL